MGCGKLKIIALDIDGVLNTPSDYTYIQNYVETHPGSSRQIPGLMYYDMGDFVNVKHLVELQRIHKETGAVILGTSAWFHNDTAHIGISEFFQIPIIGRSAHNTGGGYWRAKGIMEYIQETQPAEYVIFDDVIEGYERFDFQHRLFCTARSGLTRDIANTAISILNGEYDEG